MGVFDLFKKAVQTLTPSTADAGYSELIREAFRELKSRNYSYWWGLKANECEVYIDKILPLSDQQKLDFILEATEAISRLNKNKTSWSSEDVDWAFSNIYNAFMRQLLRCKLNLQDGDLVEMLNAFTSRSSRPNADILDWPIASVLGQVESYQKDHALSRELIVMLEKVLEAVKKPTGYDEKNRIKMAQRISNIIFKNDNGTIAVIPTWFPVEDAFSNYANASIKAMVEPEQATWFQLMQLSLKTSSASPSKKYLDEARELFKTFGTDKFKAIVNDWFVFISTLKETVTTHHGSYDGRDYTYQTSTFIDTANTDMIKGFVWMCMHFHDKQTLFNIASLAERTHRKIPGKGATAPAIGNACIYVLANSKGLDGVGHLSRLRLRIKQTNTQTLIEKHLYKAAAKQNVSIHEIEDMAVDDYGLQQGSATFVFDEYTAVLNITGVGKTELRWLKQDGSPQKAVPAFVKEKYGTKLKKLKETIKQIELTTTGQRDRIDRMFKSDRTLSWSHFNEFYFSHGLMEFISKKLLWTFTEGAKKETAIFKDGAWVNPHGALSFEPSEATSVNLWHPVFSSVEEIQGWRNFLMDHKIVQPLKQAFREVYIITDAEVNTGTYSNRMAAHILKQHQFSSLAKTRGWKYSLMGNFDNGIDHGLASTVLNEYGLKAEFWINEIIAEDAVSDSGIWNYVATDQVRFIKTGSGDVIDLLDVPALVFTEIMRDVDLFVGVASVGNDPQWRDNGGLIQYRDYWQHYSFGDLTEVAKTRKNILERLVPRLAIGKVSEIKDRFLVVKGKLRTYKIHLGSTNILMEPNDQYLCIVPDRSVKPAAENLFLGFEGDNGVSVILSKAMLLADDDKITDGSITSQIKRQ